MGNARWKMEDPRCKMEDARWKMHDGKRKQQGAGTCADGPKLNFYFFSPCLQLHTGRFWLVGGVLKSASGSQERGAKVSSVAL